MLEITELRLDSAAGASADFSAGSILFVGTATVILRYAGFTILTDPNFLRAGDHRSKQAQTPIAPRSQDLVGSS